MNYLLLSPSGAVIGPCDRLSTLVQQSASIRFDFIARWVVVDGVPDTMSFGPDYSDAELLPQLSARALTLLRRRGYTLYESQD